MFVVDGSVQTEIVLDPTALFVSAHDSHNMAAMHLAQLTDDTAGSTSGSGDDQCFAGLWFSEFEQAEVGGETIDAQSAKEAGVGEKRDGRNFLKGRQVAGANDDISLQSSEADNFVALLEGRMARFNDFGQTESAHDLTERDGRHVLRNVCHPYAQGGVDGKKFDTG